jgi:hypothetical protein
MLAQERTIKHISRAGGVILKDLKFMNGVPLLVVPCGQYYQVRSQSERQDIERAFGSASSCNMRRQGVLRFGSVIKKSSQGIPYACKEAGKTYIGI